MVFPIDERLQAETLTITTLELCQVRLMDDRRYPWLILVPERDGVTEVLDLMADDQALLWQEVTFAAQLLRERHPALKLNLGALGNVVRQLHVHLVARSEQDPAWPGPVWGHSPRQPYDEAEAAAQVATWRQAFAEARRP